MINDILQIAHLTYEYWSGTKEVNRNDVPELPVHSTEQATMQEHKIQGSDVSICWWTQRLQICTAVLETTTKLFVHNRAGLPKPRTPLLIDNKMYRTSVSSLYGWNNEGLDVIGTCLGKKNYQDADVLPVAENRSTILNNYSCLIWNKRFFLSFRLR